MSIAFIMNPHQSVFDHQAFLKTVTQSPGVYQMMSADGSVLYVGKANQLKNRLASYFRQGGLSSKTRALVAKIARIEVTVTNTEVEALLLEQNLIKQQYPTYNILLRDDKSYPYIYLSEHSYPQLVLFRGAKKKTGRYFGPYPSASAAKESLRFLQKVFKVRQCDDSFFSHRSRPCLQYQIGRCSAPCVNYITVADYAESIRHMLMFLEAKSKVLIQELANSMEVASQALDFEKAAQCRDTIRALQQMQAAQCIEGEAGNIDIVACVCRAGAACVHVLFVRQGRILGSKSYFPTLRLDESPKQVLDTFLAHYYTTEANMTIPKEIITNYPLMQSSILQAALVLLVDRQVAIHWQVRGTRLQWLTLAEKTADQNLTSHLADKQSLYRRYAALQDALALPELPQRLECFDISHSQGEATVASCVVFDHQGPLTSAYRRLTIEGIQAGDDYAAMHQALRRYYTRLKFSEGESPDILFIDGGKGQVKQAVKVLEELQITHILVIGIAKGIARKPGLETLYRADTQCEFTLASDSLALHLIQHIRDESHRFALTGHRRKRDKTRRESPLQSIHGVGPKRRRELLRHFGGWQAISKASVEDLKQVPGISVKLAKLIYAELHRQA